MATSELERIIGFEHRFARAQASDVVELDWGFAHLQHEFPLSHAHNRVVVTGDAETSEVIATADRILGEANRSFRHVWIDREPADEAALTGLIADFTAAGYDHQPLVYMVHDGSSPEPPAPDGPEVQELTVEEMRPAFVRDWHIDLPHGTDEEIDQLADRTTLYGRAAETAFLAVLDGDQVAARAELYLDRASGIAQFESLVTHADFRSRGYGTALVADALRRSSDAGCDLSFLTADADDWPRQWYARLGYAEIHRVHEFARLDT